jgi:hypothetical protein
MVYTLFKRGEVIFILHASRRGEAFQIKRGFYPVAGKSHGFASFRYMQTGKVNRRGV